jgi:hypothetical protein
MKKGNIYMHEQKRVSIVVYIDISVVADVVVVLTPALCKSRWEGSIKAEYQCPEKSRAADIGRARYEDDARHVHDQQTAQCDHLHRHSLARTSLHYIQYHTSMHASTCFIGEWQRRHTKKLGEADLIATWSRCSSTSTMDVRQPTMPIPLMI